MALEWSLHNVGPKNNPGVHLFEGVFRESYQCIWVAQDGSLLVVSRDKAEELVRFISDVDGGGDWGVDRGVLVGQGEIAVAPSQVGMPSQPSI